MTKTDNTIAAPMVQGASTKSPKVGRFILSSFLGATWLLGSGIVALSASVSRMTLTEALALRTIFPVISSILICYPLFRGSGVHRIFAITLLLAAGFLIFIAVIDTFR